MNILGWIVIGGVAGWLAAAIVGARRQGCIWNIVIGILGAVLGGFIYQAATNKKFSFDFSLTSLGVATLGAIGLLLVINLIKGRRWRV